MCCTALVRGLIEKRCRCSAHLLFRTRERRTSTYAQPISFAEGADDFVICHHDWDLVWTRVEHERWVGDKFEEARNSFVKVCTVLTSAGEDLK